MTDKPKFLLDSLIPPAELAKLKLKRRAKKHDLRELLPKKEILPDVDELLPPFRVTLHVQENTCSTCGEITRLPLGLISTHQLIRNKRRTGIEIGVPVERNNSYPSLVREIESTRTTSMVCCRCANEARTIPQPEPLHAAQIATLDYRPKPAEPAWHSKYGFATNESIHQHAERIAQAEERLRVELKPVVVPDQQFIPDSEEE